MASGSAIASTAANSRGCAAVKAGLTRPQRPATLEYATTLANPGIDMYLVTSKRAKNWSRPMVGHTGDTQDYPTDHGF